MERVAVMVPSEATCAAVTLKTSPGLTKLITASDWKYAFSCAEYGRDLSGALNKLAATKAVISAARHKEFEILKVTSSLRNQFYDSPTTNRFSLQPRLRGLMHVHDSSSNDRSRTFE